MKEKIFYYTQESLQGSQAQCERKEKSQRDDSMSHVTFPKEEEMVKIRD